MAAIVQANANSIGSGLPVGVVSLDSNTVLAVGSPGTPQRRLTMGVQQRPTQPIQCDATAGVAGNFIPSNQNSPYGASATITNITVASAVNNVNTVTFSATNSFVAGQSVKLTGLTTVPALNNLGGPVLSTGLSGSGFQITVAGLFNFASVGSSAETGTAVVDFHFEGACLSLGSETE